MSSKNSILIWCSMPLLVLGLALFTGCGHEDDHAENPGQESGQDSGGHAEEGSFGGTISVVGEHAAHIELVHDDGAGKVTLYITGPEGQTPLLIEEAPKLNLSTNDGNKQVPTMAVNGTEKGASQFEAKDEALKEHFIEGRIAIIIDGKSYAVEIMVEHDHEHD